MNFSVLYFSYQPSVRRRRSAIVTRSVQIPKPDIDGDSDEFAV